MNTNLTREERIRNVAAGQMVEELKGRHAYLHGVNFGREEYGVFWLRSTDTTWGHGWGRLIGYDEMFKAYCGQDAEDMFGSSRFGGWFGHEMDGHDRRSTNWSSSHVLASPIIEVADDGLTARSWYLTPGTMMNRFGRDGQHRDGGWLWERYGSDFVFHSGKWWWAHEQVCPDIAGSLDHTNWARSSYQRLKNPALGPGGPGGPGGLGGASVDKEAALRQAERYQGGHVFVADTLEELAEKLGVPAEVFTATVTRYNELCAKGHDDDFYKLPNYLKPIETAPFFAIRSHMATDGVFGGLDADENGSVLSHGVPVEGLYCAGDTIGNRYINQGGEKLECINDFYWAFASGYLAGKKILERLG